MVIIAITPLLLMSDGTIPLGESYAAVLGFWLYGCACIAVGMFISSLTESQVISAVLTFVALFAGYMMGKRGLEVAAVHFVSPPYTSAHALEKVRTLCKKRL